MAFLLARKRLGYDYLIVAYYTSGFLSAPTLVNKSILNSEWRIQVFLKK